MDLVVARLGGHRPKELFGSIDGFENADWVFPQERIIIEHKQIETNYTDTPRFRRALQTVNARYAQAGLLQPFKAAPDDYLKSVALLYQPHLADLAKKANRQIRSTAKRLGWTDHLGVLLLSNRDFLDLSPHSITIILGDLLLRHYSEINAFIYLTNHYVEVPGSDLAHILWSPHYHPDTPDRLQPFINELGGAYYSVANELIGPFDEHREISEPGALVGMVPIRQGRNV